MRLSFFKKMLSNLLNGNEGDIHSSYTKEELNKHLNSLSSEASIAQIRGERPMNNFAKSRIAGSFLMKKDESWPSWEKGYLDPILQINVDELPYIPEKLKKFKLITIFIAIDDFLDDSALNKSCQVRTYEDFENLELKASPIDAKIKTFEIDWRLKKDAPAFETFMWQIGGPEEYARNKEQIKEIDFDENMHRNTKVGGWPTIIQHELEMDYSDFVIQIGSEEKVRLNWIDGGSIYVGYNGKKWFFECQFY